MSIASIEVTDGFHQRAASSQLLAYWEAEYRHPYPETGAEPHIWRWEEMKQLLQETTKFIPIDEAQRRGLILTNPGLSGPWLTPTMFADIQLLNPGERAPCHRHTSSASRLVMEGSGAYTVVEGEKCYMEPGDFVLNPSWDWHDHGNEGDDQVVYLNVLDIPLVETLGCIFYDVDYKAENDIEENFQSQKKPINASEELFKSAGLLPHFIGTSSDGKSPQLMYKWEQARYALEALKKYPSDPYDGHILEYVNPKNGRSVLATMSFNLQLLEPGQMLRKHRHTTSTVYWAVEGEGRTDISGQGYSWKKNDVFVIPSWKWHSHSNSSSTRDAVLLSVTDSPAVKSFDLYREEAETPDGTFAQVTD